MTADEPIRQRVARASLRERSLGLARHAGWPVHVCWPRFQRHVVGMLLAPELCESGTVLAWRWSEPTSSPPVSGRELAAMRRRLEDAAAALARAADDSAEEGDLLRTIGQVVHTLATCPDARLEGFLCRTTHGLQIHSWGLAAPGSVADDTAAGGAQEPAAEALSLGAGISALRAGGAALAPRVGRGARGEGAKARPEADTGVDPAGDAQGGEEPAAAGPRRRWSLWIWGALGLVGVLAGVVLWRSLDQEASGDAQRVDRTPRPPVETIAGAIAEPSSGPSVGASTVPTRAAGEPGREGDGPGGRGNRSRATVGEDGGAMDRGAGAPEAALSAETGFRSAKAVGSVPDAALGDGSGTLAPASGGGAFRDVADGVSPTGGAAAAVRPTAAGSAGGPSGAGLHEGRFVPSNGSRGGGRTADGRSSEGEGLEMAAAPESGSELRRQPGAQGPAAAADGSADARTIPMGTPEGDPSAQQPTPSPGREAPAGEARRGEPGEADTAARPHATTRGEPRAARQPGPPSSAGGASAAGEGTSSSAGGPSGPTPPTGGRRVVSTTLDPVPVLHLRPARLELLSDLPAPTEPERDGGTFDPVAWHRQWRGELRARVPADLSGAVPWTGLRLIRQAAAHGGPLRWSGNAERSGVRVWEGLLVWRESASSEPAAWLAEDDDGVVARVTRNAEGSLTLHVRSGTVPEICLGLATLPVTSGGGRALAWRAEDGTEPTEWRGASGPSPWGWGPTVSWRAEATPKTGVTFVVGQEGALWGWRRRIDVEP